MEDTSGPSWGVVLVLVLLLVLVIVAAGPWINAALDAIIL
jgi:hypothetical protein